MKALLALIPVALFAAASCGPVAEKPSSHHHGPGSSVTSKNHVPGCQATCSAATDCGVSNDPLYDSSHFACNGGLCQWQGCKAASECKSEAHGGNFLCIANGGGVPSCVPACNKAADCVPPGQSVALDDASHFACNGGACEWLGCRSTGECSTALHTSKVSCERPPGAPASTCVPTCNTSADCAMQGGSALSDAHHYACVANRCQWTGCKSTLECTQALSSSHYICE